MTKHVYLILTATFVFGFVSGAILFLYNYQGGERDNENFEDDSTISITAYRYGGCSRTDGCASYRITDTGNYTYIVRNSEKGETRLNGLLSSAEKTVLFKTLRDTNLSSLEDSIFAGTCPVEYDGNAYQYTVVYKGERYQFDTCKQLLTDVPLFSALTDYFDVFETTYATP